MTASGRTRACKAECLLIKVALARREIEIVTLAETPQDRLDVSGQLQSLKRIGAIRAAECLIGDPIEFNSADSRAESDFEWN